PADLEQPRNGGHEVRGTAAIRRADVAGDRVGRGPHESVAGTTFHPSTTSLRPASPAPAQWTRTDRDSPGRSENAESSGSAQPGSSIGLASARLMPTVAGPTTCLSRRHE